MNDLARKIIHCDCDCFYAAVEMRDNPALRTLPVAVGGRADQRGVIATCNYEARRYGIHSAMATSQAMQRCPSLVLLPPAMEKYRAASRQILAIYRDYTDLVEPLSLDEAYLDVTGLDRYAWDIAKDIRRRILAETQLTSSAGIAPNKMLAKIASDWRKPNGQFAVTPDQIDGFIRELPVRKIWGVGPKSAEKFALEGIRTCGDLQRFTLPEMVKRHGKWGHELYHLCRGHDDRPVEPDQVRKSLSNECTYAHNLTTLEECQKAMDELVSELEVEVRTKTADRPIHKAFVKVKFADFTRTTRECVHAHPTRETYQALLIEARQRSAQPIRLLGSGVRFAEERAEEISPQRWLDLD